MKKIALIFLLFTSGCANLMGESFGTAVGKGYEAYEDSRPPERAAFSRYLMISTCYQNEKTCRAPVAKYLEYANVTAPFDKNIAMSSTAVTEEDLNFIGTVRIKWNEGYYISLEIHSGNSDKRKSEVITVMYKSLKDLKEHVLMDKPIPFKKGILRAQLVFGPPLNITK